MRWLKCVFIATVIAFLDRTRPLIRLETTAARATWRRAFRMR